MPTLILTPRYTEDAQALWQAAGRLGWSVERLPSWRIPPHILSVPDPVLYVEVVFAPMFTEAFGIRLVEPDPGWLPSLPWRYRKRQVVLSTLGEARQLTEPAFIKPPNDKSFVAKVYHAKDLPRDFPDGAPVLISEVVKWETEFRCYVLDNELRTFSVYLRNGELQREHGFISSESEDQELTSFVTTFLRDRRVRMPKAAVLDVGVMQDRGWAVIEQNAPWGAGLYGCDPTEVLKVLQHAQHRDP